MDLRVSVVIPVYNAEAYLRECLDSVFNQDFDGYEVICVDDGSKDNSGRILDEYRQIHANMTVIHQANAGISCARNSGISLVKGNYVYFLDNDDYMLPNALRQMYDFAEKLKLDVACFNAQTGAQTCYFSTGFNVRKVSGNALLKLYHRYEHSYFASPVWLYLYKMDFIRCRQLMFVPHRLHEDYEFNCRALYFASSCALNNIPVLFHRIMREGSIMSNITEKNYEARLCNFRDLFAFYCKHRVKGQFVESLLCLFLSVLSDSHRSGLSMKSIGLKCSDFLKFVVVSPFYIGIMWRRIRKSFR